MMQRQRTGSLHADSHAGRRSNMVASQVAESSSSPRMDGTELQHIIDMQLSMLEDYALGKQSCSPPAAAKRKIHPRASQCSHCSRPFFPAALALHEARCSQRLERMVGDSSSPALCSSERHDIFLDAPVMSMRSRPDRSSASSP